MKNFILLLVLVGLLFLGYRYYQKNNMPANKNSPSVTETPKETVYTYKLYFNNTIKDPNLIDCSLVYEIERKSLNPITPDFVMRELIKGLTPEETKLGFVTAIPKKCELNFVTVENEKATVDFKPFQIAGSCATSAFTAQVKQTMLALSTIKEVVITIQGKSEEILQP